MGKDRRAYTWPVSNRKKMHPRNLYNNKPDFADLAKFRPSLKPFLILKSRSPTKQLSVEQHLIGDNTSTPPPLDLSSSSINQPMCSSHDDNQHSSGVASLSSSERPPPVDTKSMVRQRTEKFAYTLDFSNPAALRELSCAVLEKDFELKVEMPLDMLIPAVPQRLNYIHWIEDLLSCMDTDGARKGTGGVATSDSNSTVTIPKGDAIIGIDIGKGSL